MRGGAQGQLMLGADGHVYVVKFQNNPQHMRVLANELLASRLAAAAGLTVPHADLIEVSSWLIENTPELEIDLGQDSRAMPAGTALRFPFCGRAYARPGGGLPGRGATGRGKESRRVRRHSGSRQVDRETPTAARRYLRAASASAATRPSSSTSGIASTPATGYLKMRPCAGSTTATMSIGM